MGVLFKIDDCEVKLEKFSMQLNDDIADVIALSDMEGCYEDCIIETWKNCDGLLHRLNGAALIIRNVSSGSIIHSEHLRNGKHHRENDKPAIHIETKDIIIEEYCQEGRPFRQDCREPYIVETYKPTGIVRLEKWAKNGLDHRDKGASHIVRDSLTGIVTMEMYEKNGELHRDTNIGPAIVRRDGRTGHIENIEYYLNGKNTTHLVDIRPLP